MTIEHYDVAAASATGTFCPMAATVDGATSFPVVLPPADPASFGSDCTDVGKVKFVDIFGNGAGAGRGKPAGNVTPPDVPPKK